MSEARRWSAIPHSLLSDPAAVMVSVLSLSPTLTTYIGAQKGQAAALNGGQRSGWASEVVTHQPASVVRGVEEGADAVEEARQLSLGLFAGPSLSETQTQTNTTPTCLIYNILIYNMLILIC